MAYYLALDASTKSTGWAIFQEKELIDYGCITISSNDTFKRIKYQTKEIKKLLQKHNFSQIILEEVVTDGRHSRTWKVLMWLQASINFMLYDNQIHVDVQYFYPSSWRSKCGIKNGKGIKRDKEKQYDKEFVKKKYGLDVNDDIADAIGIGYAFVSDIEEGYDFK